MFKVGVVLLPQFYLSSASGVMDTFQIANAHIRNQQGPEASQFQCETLSQAGGTTIAQGGIKLQADTSIANAGDYDLIYVPAFFYQGITAYESLAEELQPLLQWLVERWQRGTRLACNCTAAFLLAETGLLNGRQATTSWWLERQFRRRFPWVQLDVQATVTEADRLYCSAAMSAHLSLALRFVELQCGAPLAALCSKTMLVDYRDRTQPSYQNLLEEGPSDDPVVAKTQYWLQNHVRDRVDMEQLADKMKVSQRTLIRRFKAELGVPPLTYLQNLRIETAKQLLESTNMPLVNIIEQVGYSDVSSFSRLFKQRIGVTPAGYRQRLAAG
ncbi:MAG: helix-turn-helix domain-containing protein [Gammaproteobacteria bacterium]|nr:helix-turn-helix domain-containing protein [Gammaproteobacteria bacterium]